MRDRETIDSELRLIALRRQSVREQGGQPSSEQVDDLLDERLGHRARASETEAAGDPTGDGTSHRRAGVLRRFGPLSLLPLSLLAAGATFVAMFGGHNQQSAEPAPVEVPPPPISQTNTAAPQAQTPIDLADRVFFDVLNKEGVPVPSHEYATAQAHSVCGFLERQPNLAYAARFVQQSSIWDADQSAHFVAGAVVTYCPQYVSATPPMQPGLQNSLSDMQAIQRDMRSIQGDLQSIRDHLPALPGE
ncbi:DUF732 domain-containing protein [Mycobacterium riyadhense]|uniref:DUF732 domain-containing protein n=1 Tax=Mycobacterium riyadhense TaxID=486698 RepID=A0A653EU12_9MYCO|nr:DUF732 domain-containing protein [Mycobacterium riyadhense]VTP00848.1 hypothetical protein BIN_B_03767 [Mycobacterium riyadhense]